MKLLDWLLGRQADPTSAWPICDCDIPPFNMDNMAFGTLQLGAKFQEARRFGKPDTLIWISKDYCELLYARGGFQMDFWKETLCYLSFFIGPDEFLPNHPAMTFAKPRLKDTAQLTQHTGIGGIRILFGQEESEDTDDEETILTYARPGGIMEFEFNLKGFLKRWNLYPKDQEEKNL